MESCTQSCTAGLVVYYVKSFSAQCCNVLVFTIIKDNVIMHMHIRTAIYSNAHTARTL